MSDGSTATHGHAALATLTASANELIVSGQLGTFRIPRAAVTRIGRGKWYPWLFAGIVIYHKVPGCASALPSSAIGTLARGLRQKLADFGYPAE